MRVHVGTALRVVGEVGWGTIELHRGGMLLMVATNRHHWSHALEGARNGLQGTPFDFVTPDPKHRHHQPNTTHVDRPPPSPRP